MKKIILIFVCLHATLLFAEPYFESDYWQPFSSDSKAVEAVASGELQAQIQAAMTYFFQGINSKDSKTLGQADAILKKLQRRNRKNVPTLAFSGMAALSLAGATRNLATKISKTTYGLNSLERAQLLDPENIEVLYMYLMSVWQVPTSFKNKNEKMRQFGESWLEKSPKIIAAADANIKTRLQLFNEAVLVIMAEVEQRLKDKQQASAYLSRVNQDLIEGLNNKAVEELYKSLKKQGL